MNEPKRPHLHANAGWWQDHSRMPGPLASRSSEHKQKRPGTFQSPGRRRLACAVLQRRRLRSSFDDQDLATYWNAIDCKHRLSTLISVWVDETWMPTLSMFWMLSLERAFAGFAVSPFQHS